LEKATEKKVAVYTKKIAAEAKKIEKKTKPS
jgi:hypothetical protein